MKKQNAIYFDRSSGTFAGLSTDLKNELALQYPLVSLDQEIPRMVSWLQSPKGKARKGTLGFILNWLNNATPVPCEKEERTNSATPVLLNLYLEELWKQHPYLYMFNRLET